MSTRRAWLLSLLIACGGDDGEGGASGTSTATSTATSGTDTGATETTSGTTEAGSTTGAASPWNVGSFALGDRHTCTSHQDAGQILCWGSNPFGQLGSGTSQTLGDDETPAEMPVLSFSDAAATVAAGDRHTCSLSDSGSLRCWGYGKWGQLGYASTEDLGDDETLGQLGNVDVGGTVTQLAAGGQHTCALLEGGAVRCWGFNYYGQLGLGDTVDIGDDETPASAAEVDVGGPVVQLSAGYYHTCAVLDGGAVRCWGAGSQGRLGYGGTANIGNDETPAERGDVDIGGIVVQVSAGGQHTCALMDDAALRCWGNGTRGRLGYGDKEDIGDDEAPSTVGPVDLGGAGVILVAAGGAHTCVLLDSEEVRCWGSGFSGILGTLNMADIGDDEAPTTIDPVDLGGPVAHVVTGGQHTCALRTDGALLCWGVGMDGRLGYGNVEDVGDDETPAEAGPVPLP